MPAQGSDLVMVQRGTSLHKASAAEIAALAGSVASSPHYVAPWSTTGSWVSHALNATATTTLAAAANRLDLVPFIPSRSITVDQLSIEVVTAVASAQARVGIYSSTAAGAPDALLTGQGTLLDCSTAGGKASAVNPAITLNAGTLYWLAVHASSTQTLRALAVGALLGLTTAQNVAATVETLRRSTAAFASGLPTTAPASTLASASVARVALRLA